MCHPILAVMRDTSAPNRWKAENFAADAEAILGPVFGNGSAPPDLAALAAKLPAHLKSEGTPAQQILHATASMATLTQGILEAFTFPHCSLLTDISRFQSTGRPPDRPIPAMSGLYSRLKNLSAIWQARALACLESGQPDAAADALLAMLKLARLTKEETSIVALLVEAALQGEAVNHLPPTIQYPGSNRLSGHVRSHRECPQDPNPHRPHYHYYCPQRPPECLGAMAGEHHRS